MIAVVVSTIEPLPLLHGLPLGVPAEADRRPVLVEQLRTNYAYAEIEPRERAMLDFAVKLTEQSSTVPRPMSRRCGKRAGRDEDIFDIAEVAAMFNFTNRLASGLGWVPNDEFVTLGWARRGSAQLATARLVSAASFAGTKRQCLHGSVAQFDLNVDRAPVPLALPLLRRIRADLERAPRRLVDLSGDGLWVFVLPRRRCGKTTVSVPSTESPLRCHWRK